jgi:hypothetical protein
MSRVRLVLVCLGAAALVAPATATAVVTVALAGGTLTITGTADDDDISLSSAGSNALGPTTRVSGGGQDMQAGFGCQGFGDPNGPANDNSVFCPTNGILRLEADLLEGDDELGTEGLAATVNAGPGEDEVTIGRVGSDGVNTIDGGPGDDTVHVGRAGQADDISGGAGADTVDYVSHGAVTVTLDGLSNDGTGTEADNIRPDVESVVGTAGDDTLIGSEGPNTLDGAGGTDRLEGLGGPDTLIGGLGVSDATFGGEGDDTIMLRDGLVDACASGGAGTNIIDADLRDRFFFVVNGRGVSRCLFAPLLQLPVRVAIGAVDEGPNVRMAAPAPAVRGAGVRVRLACPAALRKPCAGPLRVFALGGTSALGSIDYSIPPGRVAAVVVPLDAAARRAALSSKALRIVSVEKGRSPLGPKTTILVVPPRYRR